MEDYLLYKYMLVCTLDLDMYKLLKLMQINNTSASTIKTAPIVDLTGVRFGKLVVINKVSGDLSVGLSWNCICDCGKDKVAYTAGLISGNTKSCGCGRYTYKSLIGKRYGKLTVLNREKNSKHNHLTWCCRCDCGNIIKIVSPNLKRINGVLRSCGKCKPTPRNIGDVC